MEHTHIRTPFAQYLPILLRNLEIGHSRLQRLAFGVEARYQKKHPKRAQDAKWLAKKTRRAMIRFYTSTHAQQDIQARLEAAGS